MGALIFLKKNYTARSPLGEEYEHYWFWMSKFIYCQCQRHIVSKNKQKNNSSQMWQCTPEIPGLGKLKQKDHKYKTGLGCIMSPRPSCDIQQNPVLRKEEGRRKKKQRENSAISLSNRPWTSTLLMTHAYSSLPLVPM